MLGKAVRSKDLASYSRSNLVLANVGNAVYSVYVFNLPPGPIWMLHTFYVVLVGADAHLEPAATAAARHPRERHRRRARTAHHHPRSEPCALNTSRPSIIGAGQAGLATGYHLQRAGRPFVILDREAASRRRVAAPVGHPAPVHPGLGGRPSRAAHPGAPRWSFPTKDEFADYLETYAATFDLPVRCGTRWSGWSAAGTGMP